MSTLTVTASAGSTPTFRDGFGTRQLGIDPDAGDAVELLVVAADLVSSPDFASAVGERVARLARVRHTSYARVRRLDRPDNGSLVLYSDRVAGWRLASVLDVVERERLAIDISAVLAILRQLIPGAALFSRHQRDAAIGAVGPERVILTPQGRVVLADYVLAPGIEKLHYSRERLWRDLRVALPQSASAFRIPPSADVMGMGLIALSLVRGRRIRDNEFPLSLKDLVESATESHDGSSRSLSAGFGRWLAQALHLDENAGFRSPQEAQVAFEEMLAKERSYVTTPAQLELFIARLEKLAGPPPEPPSAPKTASLPARAAEARPAPEVPSTTPVGTRAQTRIDAPAEPVIVQAAPAVGLDVLAPSSTTGHRMFEPAPAMPSGMRAEGRWMTTALFVLASVAVAEAGFIVWLFKSAPSSAAPPSRGQVIVQSRPAAARIAIDGEDRGVTPLTMDLAPGPHVLEVRVGRSEPRVLPVVIEQGVQREIYVELQSVATVGALDIRTEPATARVTLGGQFRGTTPLILRDLPPGEHIVLLEAGSRKITQTVRIEPGVTSQLVVPFGSR
jgi:hypothetical protein